MNSDRLEKKKSKQEGERKRMIKQKNLDEKKLLRIMKPDKRNKKSK